MHGSFLGVSGNLHAFWDFNLIDHRVSTDFGGDYHAWMDFVRSNISPANVTAWTSCPDGFPFPCSTIWANESAQYACSNAYVYPNGTHIQNHFSLGLDYYNANIPLIEMRLQQAGVRLAASLNYAAHPLSAWSIDAASEPQATLLTPF